MNWKPHVLPSLSHKTATADMQHYSCIHYYASLTSPSLPALQLYTLLQHHWRHHHCQHYSCIHYYSITDVTITASTTAVYIITASLTSPSLPALQLCTLLQHHWRHHHCQHSIITRQVTYAPTHTRNMMQHEEASSSITLLRTHEDFTMDHAHLRGLFSTRINNCRRVEASN